MVPLLTGPKNVEPTNQTQPAPQGGGVGPAAVGQLEPGLPWVTPEMEHDRPLGRHGMRLIWCICEFGTDGMAPRFPKGCRVNIARVQAKKDLVIGAVYVYVFTDPETGEEVSEAGRLEKIGDNYLQARADNNPVPSFWLLREGVSEAESLRDVWEVTHYTRYPVQ
ncbi:MAG: hypothetical protein ACRYFX_10840 [Janthinobacterium lividum]